MTKTQVAIIWFVVGVVVGGGYVKMGPEIAMPDILKKWVKTDATSAVVVAGQNNEEEKVLVKNVTESPKTVVVNDQEAGKVVFVSSLNISGSTWVAIHEDLEGEPGRILGARRYDAGISSGDVELLRPTVKGGVYYALLYADDGDRQFDSKLDPQVKDESGKTVMASFVAK